MSKTIYINDFSGGIVNDPRATAENVARVVTNFDVLTDAHRMVPYRDSESGDSSASTSQKQNFCTALRVSATPTHSLYALGVVSGTGRAEVLYKDFTTGSPDDLDDATWTNTANNTASSGNTSFNLFVYYRKATVANSRIYGASGGTRIWSYDPIGSAAFDDDGVNVTYTNIAQGLVHPKDDILYIPYDNKIMRKNQGSAFEPAVLTLPSDLYIKSIAEHGNYLAIACAPLSGVGNSKVFIWDRDSSLATLSDSIDWGSETLQFIEEVDGILIGVSQSSGLGVVSSTRFQDRVVFRYLAVSSAVKFAQLLGGTSTTLRSIRQRVNSRVYFLMSIELNGAVREGVWSVGRESPYVPFSVIHERTPNNDTAISNGALNGFYLIGDFMFIAYQTSGAFALSKTNDTASYTATSIWESTINPKMPLEHRVLNKTLVSVGATYEALPANGQIVVQYKVNGGAFQTIFTETTDSAVRTEPKVTDANGVQFTDAVEYEFRVESTGGAKFTGLQYKYDTKITN